MVDSRNNSYLQIVAEANAPSVKQHHSEENKHKLHRSSIVSIISYGVLCNAVAILDTAL